MVKLPTLRELADAGVHFGHKTSRWHPKMAQFIFTSKNGVHVINLEKTEEELVRATDFLKKLSSEGKTIVFVGSKKQASALIKKAALDCGMPYIDHRWVGGTLTNFDIVKSAITKFKKTKEELASEKARELSKKEISRMSGAIERGEKIYGGLTELNKKPDAFILLGAHDEENALTEANLSKIPVVAIVDTNTDPTPIDFPIPANDDATKSLQLFAELFSSIIKENKNMAKVQEQK